MNHNYRSSFFRVIFRYEAAYLYVRNVYTTFLINARNNIIKNIQMYLCILN